MEATLRPCTGVLVLIYRSKSPIHDAKCGLRTMSQCLYTVILYTGPSALPGNISGQLKLRMLYDLCAFCNVRSTCSCPIVSCLSVSRQSEPPSSISFRRRVSHTVPALMKDSSPLFPPLFPHLPLKFNLSLNLSF